MAGLIEAEFEKTVAAGKPLFHYTTTIQNHMSYTPDKYGPDYVYPELPLQASLSPETEACRVYGEGARDADAMLGRLRELFLRPGGAGGAGLLWRPPALPGG